jgi:hypothetical protein
LKFLVADLRPLVPRDCATPTPITSQKIRETSQKNHLKSHENPKNDDHSTLSLKLWFKRARFDNSRIRRYVIEGGPS